MGELQFRSQMLNYGGVSGGKQTHQLSVTLENLYSLGPGRGKIVKRPEWLSKQIHYTEKRLKSERKNRHQREFEREKGESVCVCVIFLIISYRGERQIEKDGRK